MPVILDISTAVPPYMITQEEMLRFYERSLNLDPTAPFLHKLSFLNKKTKIEKRYSCLPDFKSLPGRHTGQAPELYSAGNYCPDVTKRMEVYRRRIIPLAAEAIDKLLESAGIETSSITHLITVSCTGLTAPGIEFQLAEKYNLQHVEKTAINFLGCYAAMKALKQAYYIAQSDPMACVLIVCAELCSLHFSPSEVDEDIVANLLFADGASAAFVCGDQNKHLKNKTILRLDTIGSAYIPSTFELMTWNVTSSNFKMHLSKHIASTIRENIQPVVKDFLKGKTKEVDFWAIHPGGVKIVEAVKESLNLTDSHVQDSMNVLRQYGNMSSPTILFILKSIFDSIRESEDQEPKSIFSCAFGPGINVEMISFTSLNTALLMEPGYIETEYEFEV
jgi:predicted naringenin-chalcone synthase